MSGGSNVFSPSHNCRITTTPIYIEMSHVMRKSAFCIYENKGSDQLRSNCAADQRLCFRYTDSTIPLLRNSKISSVGYLLQIYSLVYVGNPEDRFSHDAAQKQKHRDNLSVCFIPQYTPLLYSKTGVYRGIHFFLIFALKHRLWVLVRTASLRRFQCLPTIYVLRKNMKIIKKILMKIFIFTAVKNRCMLHGRVFVTQHAVNGLHRVVLRYSPTFLLNSNVA